jgi:DNA uptake protein ComE-like DNA-binding protein
MPQAPLIEPQGVLWASIPLLTFGLGAPIAFIYAGTRRRSLALPAAGIGYLAGYLGVFGLLISGSWAVVALGLMLFMTLWVTSSIHALMVRSQVYPRRSRRDRANAQAVEVAKYRRALREQARQIVAEDPALALELRIGRPDLPRAYDDGGLVDVNHCPPPTLGLLPGLTDELIQQVVRVRAEQGGFISVEELGVQADLPPDLVQRISEYAIFIR